MAPEESQTHCLAKVENLHFSYTDKEPTLKDVNFTVRENQRIVLIGLNGAGKSTFLRVLCGYHLATWDKFSIYGKDTGGKIPWCDQFNGLAYLGGKWTTQRGFTGPEPFSMDVAAGEMMKDWQEEFKDRRDVLAKILGVNLEWRMNRLSDGQRKKVRIMLKLMRPFKLCVVDEFAVELDIMSRTRFMSYLANECETRGASVIYATHIFDQVDDWATHIAFLNPDKTLSAVHDMKTYEPYLKFRNDKSAFSPPMYRLVMDWMLKLGDPHALEFGDTEESEHTAAREKNPYDGGYESGRSKLFAAEVMGRTEDS